MTLKEEKKIAKKMSNYKKNEFKLYLDEAGWEVWMEKYVSGSEPTESEIKKIETIQKNIWLEVFNAKN